MSQTHLSLIRIFTRSNKLHAWKNMHAYCLPTNNLHTYVYSIYILKYVGMLLIFLWLWSQSSTCSRFSCHQKYVLKKQSQSLISDIAPLLGPFLNLAVSFESPQIERKNVSKMNLLKIYIFSTICRHLRGSKNRILKSINDKNLSAIMDTKSNQIWDKISYQQYNYLFWHWNISTGEEINMTYLCLM